MLLSILASAIAWIGVPAYRWQRFSAERDRIDEVVERWESPPVAEDPTRWRASWEAACTAIPNVCFTPDHVSIKEMVRLREDIEQRDKSPITFETLTWLWNRLAQTGPHGNEYITRMRPWWDEVTALETKIPGPPTAN